MNRELLKMLYETGRKANKRVIKGKTERTADVVELAAAGLIRIVLQTNAIILYEVTEKGKQAVEGGEQTVMSDVERYLSEVKQMSIEGESDD